MIYIFISFCFIITKGYARKAILNIYTKQANDAILFQTAHEPFNIPVVHSKCMLKIRLFYSKLPIYPLKGTLAV